MIIIFSCFEYSPEPQEHYYVFETIIDPTDLKGMFEEFKSRYDEDETPTLEEFEDWLDEMVKHSVIKPVKDWDCLDIEVHSH